MKNLTQVLAIGILMFTAAAYGAADGQTSATGQGGESSRMAKRFGTTFGISDPYPALLGMKVNYNMTDYLRASIGGGEAEVFGAKSSTIAAGLTAAIPGWSFSPTGGLNITNVTSNGLDVNGFEGSGTALIGTVGFDWQTEGGFNLAAGMNLPLGGKGRSTMYTSIGWFFDIN